MKIRKSRTIVAFSLSILILFCHWYETVFLTMISLTVFFSCKELYKLKAIKFIFFLLPFIIILYSEIYSYFPNYFPNFSKYLLSKNDVIVIIIFTQVSDVFQFIGGKISNYIFNNILSILNNELRKLNIELKNTNLNFKNSRELSNFLRIKIKEFHLFKISPKKTILGYIFGFWFSLIIFSLIFPILNWKVNIIWFFTGCAGDLFASYIKRSVNVKDFSNLLGDHGGFLDRFDSTLGVLHINYLYLYYKYLIS